MVKSAKSERPVVAEAKDFHSYPFRDSEPMERIDLTTGEIQPHNLTSHNQFTVDYDRL